MRGPASVSVDDDLTSSKSSIGGGSSNDEGLGGVDDNLGVSEHLSGAHLLDNLLGEHGPDGLIVDIRGVLGGDEDVVDGKGLDSSVDFLVFNNNLRLAVGSQPRNFSTVSLLSHSLGNLVGQVVREGEQGLGIPLVGGVSEHESLISSSKVFDVLLLVHGVSDLGGLAFNLHEHVAVVAVESDVGRGVANFLADAAGNGFVVDLLFAGDFSKESDLVVSIFDLRDRTWWQSRRPRRLRGRRRGRRRVFRLRPGRRACRGGLLRRTRRRNGTWFCSRSSDVRFTN